MCPYFFVLSVIKSSLLCDPSEAADYRLTDHVFVLKGKKGEGKYIYGACPSSVNGVRTGGEPTRGRGKKQTEAILNARE